MTEPIDPDRLSRLLDDAVRQVTVPAGALERIHHGVRRRRTLRQAGATLLAAAVLAGGSATVLLAASGGVGAPTGPSPASASSAGSSPPTAATPTPALDDLAASARIQPYLPPASLSAVGEQNWGGGTGAVSAPGTATPRAAHLTPFGSAVVTHTTQEHDAMS